METFYCNYTLPFYYEPTNQCLASCPDRTGKISNTSCIQCTYACYTCDQSQCLSCNSSTDHRTLANGTCVPQPGYYETNSAAAELCPTGCSLCSSLTLCTACLSTFTLVNSLCVCPPRTFLNSSCIACRFDCYTCDQSQCLSCNSSTDHRTLANGTCVPQPGYYETNSAAAGLCPTGCSLCSSLTLCTACLPAYYIYQSLCQLLCPYRFVFNSSNCVNCPFDC
jgi:hypothetical protein